MKIVKTLTVGVILFCGAGIADANTASDLLEHYQNKTPVSDFPSGLDLNQAAAVQSELVTRLSATLGPVVGYKAGLTNPTLQQQFGVDHPLRGVLLEKMLLPDGAELPAGISLRVGDLLSLGTVTRLLPAKPGTRVVARYSDLDPAGPVSISVAFR